MLAAPAIIWCAVAVSFAFNSESEHVAIPDDDLGYAQSGSIVPGETHRPSQHMELADKLKNKSTLPQISLTTPSAQFVGDDNFQYSELVLSTQRNGHSNRIFSVSSDSRGDILMTASEDGLIQLWSISNGAILETITLPKVSGNDYTRVFAADLSPDGKQIAIGHNVTHVADDGTRAYRRRLFLISTITGKVIQTLTQHETSGEFLTVQFSPDGKRLIAAGGIEFPMYVFRKNRNNWSIEREVPHNDCIIYSASFSPKRDQDLAVSCDTASIGGHVRIYDRRMRLKYSIPRNGSPARVDYSPDGQTLALTHWGRMIVDFIQLPARQSGEPEVTRVDIRRTLGLGANRINYTAAVVAWRAQGDGVFVGGDALADETVIGSQTALYFVSSDGAVTKQESGTLRAFAAIHSTSKGRTFIGTNGGDIFDVGLRKHSDRFSQSPAFMNFADIGFREAYLSGTEMPTKNLKVSGDGKTVLLSTYSDVGEEVFFKFDINATGDWASLISPEDFDTFPAPLPNDSSDNIRVAQWRNNIYPRVNGRRIGIHWNDTSRSVHIDPDSEYFLLGTDFSIFKRNRDNKSLWPANIQLPAAAFRVNVSADEKWIIATLMDGTVRWFDMETGRHALSQFAVLENNTVNWIAWTPEGYYAASAGAEDLVGWFKGQGPNQTMITYAISRFHKKYDRPALVKSALDGEFGKQTLTREELKAIAPPRVKILSIEDGEDGERRIRFIVETENNAPVTDIRIFVDEETYPLEGTRPQFLPNVEQEISIRTNGCEKTIAMAAEAAGRFSEVDRGAGRSRPRRCDTGIPAAKPNLFALVIGINNYDDRDIKDLSYAVNDAEKFTALLEAQEGGFYGNVEVRTLVDSVSEEQQPTYQNINTGLDWLKRSTIRHEKEVIESGERAQGRTVGVLFIAGHGMEDPLTSEYYYLAKNTNLSNIANTVVKGSVVQSDVALAAGRTFVFLDTCYAANVGNGRLVVIDVESFSNRLAAQESRAIVFASSARGELAKESAEWGGHGAFTKSLLEGFAGKADSSGDDTITNFELVSWLSEDVPNKTGNQQTPKFVPGASRTKIGAEVAQ